LAIGKPMGVGLATWASVKAKIAVLPVDVTPVALLGAAVLCGIGDPLSLLAADREFPARCVRGCGQDWRLGELRLRSAVSGADLPLSPPAVAEARRADCQLPTPAKAAENNAGVGKN
jgi:hypothetical protein